LQLQSQALTPKQAKTDLQEHKLQKTQLVQSYHPTLITKQ